MHEFVSLGGNCAVAYNLKKYNISNNRLPFDWCEASINKINQILENRFLDFTNLKVKKLSKNHNLINENINSNKPSLILSNVYNIKFAHEIVDKYQLEEFSVILKNRIKKFYGLKNPVFIRLEIGSKSVEYFQKQYYILINQLKNIYVNFKLILILNIKFNKIKFPKNVTVYYFTNYSSDWRYPNLIWNDIFNDN
jgi:hypothetical protein